MDFTLGVNSNYFLLGSRPQGFVLFFKMLNYVTIKHMAN